MKLVSGSKASALLGLATYRNANESLTDLVSAMKGDDVPFVGNVASDYSLLHFDTALSQFSAQENILVTEVEMIVKDMFCCVPRFAGNSLLHIRTPYGQRRGGEFKPIAAQPSQYAKIQFDLYVTGLSKAIFYQWSKHDDWIEAVEADEQWVADNIPRLRDIYRCAEGIANGERDFPFADRRDHLQEYRDLAEEQKLIRERMHFLKQLITRGCDGSFQLDDFKVSYVAPRESIDWRRCCEEHDLDVTGYEKTNAGYFKIS